MTTLVEGDRYDVTTDDGTVYENALFIANVGGGFWFRYGNAVLAKVFVADHEFRSADPVEAVKP